MGATWDGTCPACHEPVINTLVALGNGHYRMTWNCPDCDYWWDFTTGKPIPLCADCGRKDGGCDRTREPTP